MSIFDNIYEAPQEGTLSLENKVGCNHHRATSIKEAFDTLIQCNDFVFFPMSSINTNLTRIADWLDKVTIDLDCSFKLGCTSVLHEISDQYCTKNTKHLTKTVAHEINQLDNSFDTISSFIQSTLEESFDYTYSLIRNNKHGLKFEKENSYFGWINHINHLYNNDTCYFKPTRNWHFDFNPGINILIPMTKPGTEFCVTNYTREIWHKNWFTPNVEQEIESARCNEQIQTSSLQTIPGEAVMTMTNHALHRTPEFSGGRLLATFQIRFEGY